MTDPLAAKKDAQDANFLNSNAVPEKPAVAKRPLFVTVFAVVLLFIVAVVVLFFSVKNERVKLTTNLATQLEIASQGRADLMRTWLDGKLGMGLQLTESLVIRLISSEMDQGQDGSPLSKGSLSELPHMQTAIDDFTQQNKIVGAYLIARDGRAFLSSNASPALTPRQRRAAQQVIQNGKPLFLPIRRDGSDVFVDVAQPIRAVQAEVGEDIPKVTGALLLSLSGKALIQQVLEPGALASPGEGIWLLQSRALSGQQGLTKSGIDVIGIGADPVKKSARGTETLTVRNMAFAVRPSISAERDAFSVAHIVPGSPWAVWMERDLESALAPLLTYKLVGGGITFLLLLCIIIAIAAIWLRGKGQSNEALADQYKNLATRINAHRDLLEGINRSVPEMIGVKNLDGRYTFVNPFFVDAFGSGGEDSILNHKDADLFPPEVARIIEGLAHSTLESRKPERTELNMFMKGEKYYFKISANPFTNNEGEQVGVVTVIQDVTEIHTLHEAQKRKTEQTILALVSTIEQSDPHLVGHSDRIARIADGIAEEMGITPESRETLKQAALLSQIGKISIPHEILNKPKRLSKDEFEVMKKHISYTLETVQRLELSQDIYDTLSHMHERLDGSGYPNSLGKGEISELGQVLAVADVFAARTSSRSYRTKISANKIIKILKDNADKYAPDVVEALGAFIAKHPDKAADTPQP